jgi:hypothetical protein
MRAVDAEFEIADRRRIGRHDMHVDAEPIAHQAARIAHTALAVERKPGRQRMDDLRARCAAPGGRRRSARA